MFEDGEISLKPSVMAFITMNPGYPGRAGVWCLLQMLLMHSAALCPADSLPACAIILQAARPGLLASAAYQDDCCILRAFTELCTCVVFMATAELPESLKALFRPVSMVVPDLGLICEIMLMAEGFQMSKILSRKFVILYKLCEDLLSKSKHYDWKLRAIKTTLYVAGGMKRAAPELTEDKVGASQWGQTAHAALLQPSKP